MKNDVGIDGKPLNKEYLEINLPNDLQQSIDAYIHAFDEESSILDCYWSDLNARINSAVTEEKIMPEQAKYLRDKYLNKITTSSFTNNEVFMKKFKKNLESIFDRKMDFVDIQFEAGTNGFIRAFRRTCEEQNMTFEYKKMKWEDYDDFCDQLAQYFKKK